ncbi:MAG: sigma-54 dependent transcriptional regulator [Pirellulaceae bacterium]|nr:sigma-54 dependent transcriptional regulator [Pirellulaceae bacterium]
MSSSDSEALSDRLPADLFSQLEIIGNSPAMQEVFTLVAQVADSNASVLLLGETGTGKELVADAIHQLSDRRERPLVSVNCGALSENLLESELFGHVRGAFTGAVNNRIGRFEAAHRGTIFLDEINSTTLYLQVKLLRVLQQREYERVGDTKTLHTDVRIIAASNRNLEALIEKELFREDLYWRLNVVPIELPPLRNRRDDIPPLIDHFLAYYNRKNNRQIEKVSAEAISRLQEYYWPGNVRELQNYMERAVVLAAKDRLTIHDFPTCVRQNEKPTRKGETTETDLGALVQAAIEQAIAQIHPGSRKLYSEVMGRFEYELLRKILAETNYTQTKAAGRLGLNRNTLHKKMVEHNLEAK